ncbi:MAG: phage portal protein [Azoarcus sp.]|nr:phage portal protein [Azoarcus sp.]
MRLLSRLFSRGESSADRGAWLDTAIQTAGERAHNRYLQEMRTAQRSFETAETPAWTESWPSHAAPINDDLARQLPTLWARSCGLARNNEWAQRYLIELDDNVLGPAGMQLQMRLTQRVRGGADPVPDKAANDLLEAAWAKWGDSDCEASGLPWFEVETLALNTLARKGELLYRILPGAGPMRFQIQLLDPVLIDVSLNRIWGGNRIRMGKEIDDAGKPVAFWLQMAKTGDGPADYITVGRHMRVPAAEIRHHYLVEEVGQLRGIPWLTVGARRLWMLHDFEEAAAVASSNAAKRQGFFFSPTGEAPAGFADTMISSVLDAAKAAGKVLSPDEIQALTAAAEKYATTVPGQFDTLPQGYQFQPFESKWPTISSESYVKQQVRGWAAARGMSYVSIGNDLEAVNYSSAQVGILGEREHHKKTQTRLRNWLHREVFAAALPYLVLATPGLSASRLPEYLAAASWQPRRWAPLDPIKAANAAEIRLRLKLTSRRRLALEAGEDPDEIAAEVAAEEVMYGKLDSENMPRPKEEPDEDGTPAKPSKKE